MPQEKELLESALLVVRWQRGDAAAFDEIVRLWERPLFYYLRRLAPSEAEAWELLQETWLKAFRAMRKLREPRALPAFLYRTARNVAVSRLRHPEFLKQHAEAPRIADDSQADPIAEFQNAEQVHRALEKLPLLQREVLTLFFLQDLSLEEMAALLDVPIGTVKSRLYYAREAIRKLLSQGELDD